MRPVLSASSRPAMASLSTPLRGPSLRKLADLESCDSIRDVLRPVILLCAVQIAGQLATQEFLRGARTARRKNADADDVPAAEKFKPEPTVENVMGKFKAAPPRSENLQAIKDRNACKSSAVEWARTDGI